MFDCNNRSVSVLYLFTQMDELISKSSLTMDSSGHVPTHEAVWHDPLVRGYVRRHGCVRIVTGIIFHRTRNLQARSGLVRDFLIHLDQLSSGDLFSTLCQLVNRTQNRLFRSSQAPSSQSLAYFRPFARFFCGCTKNIESQNQSVLQNLVMLHSVLTCISVVNFRRRMILIVCQLFFANVSIVRWDG